MDDKLAELILEDFNNAVGVHDTIWYGLGITLYDKILYTIDNYNKAKEEGELLVEYNAENSI